MKKDSKQDVFRVLAEKAYQYNEEGFLLASGTRSFEYFDCKQALSMPETLAPVGRLFHEAIDPEAVAVGGLTMGADPIAILTAVVSANTNRPVRWFSVRKEKKGHGRKKMVEGQISRGEKVAIVDDVVTSGSSTIDAIEKARDFGLEVVQVLVLVDRESGGLNRIQEVAGPNVEVRSIFRLSDFERTK